MKTYLFNRVENIVSKGEIARFEQFLLLSQSFQKSSAAEASESVCGKDLRPGSYINYIMFRLKVLTSAKFILRIDISSVPPSYLTI